jgi:thiamine biosynthesis lipoprotein
MVLLFVFMISLLRREVEHVQVVSGVAQGTTYTVKYVGEQALISKAEVDSIFAVLDRSLSLYRPGSLINEFNSRGEVTMDIHLKTVVLEAMNCYDASGGAFDITVGSLADLWGFGTVRHETVPSTRSVRKRLSVTGSKYLSIAGDRLKALKSGVKIDCNGIAQGYSVDLIAAHLASKGIDRMMVELGGEIRVSGRHPVNECWTVGLESPEPLSANWYPVEKLIGVNNESVTTSGDYRKFFTTGGKKYAHVIDPRNGKPVNNGIISVTVIARDAIVADAWDNALFVVGVEKSFDVLKRMPGIEARIIYRAAGGEIRDTATLGFMKRMIARSD